MPTNQGVPLNASTRRLSRRHFLATATGASALALSRAALALDDAAATADIHSVQPDLTVPPVTTGAPAPGKRVRQTLPAYALTDVHHTLYLPADWQPRKRYPVLVDYPGNGNYHSPYGDISTGEVEGCNLGYGISGGKGFIWVAMPFVDPAHQSNQRMWWGDVDATMDYCKNTVVDVCERFGGDPAEVMLCGFSRGAIACNFIGLHDPYMADVWLAFIPYSHYDGVERWDWEGSDRASALARLELINGRASFISQEKSVDNIREYLASTPVKAPFTFQTIPYRNHNSGWTLCDIPARRALRDWLTETLRKPPGIHTVRGRVRDRKGKPAAGIRIQGGYTHWTLTNANGEFELGGLVASQRAVFAASQTDRFTPVLYAVDMKEKDEHGLNFRML